ncbi:MAG: hypothetical protein ACRYGK_03880 [Janthinobacterium lividum]
MAAGNFIFPDKAKLNFFSATDLLNAANTFKMTLHTSAWTPNNSTNEVFADVTNELATGNGYAAGGVTLSGVSLAQAAGTVKFTAGSAVWTASGGSIPSWRYGVIRAVGTFNGKVDPIVGYFLGDTTPADVPATTAPNTLTVTPSASGILSAT